MQQRQLQQFPLSFATTSFISIAPGGKVLAVAQQPGLTFPFVLVEQPNTSGPYDTVAVVPLRAGDFVRDGLEFLGTVIAGGGAPVFFFIQK